MRLELNGACLCFVILFVSWPISSDGTFRTTSSLLKNYYDPNCDQTSPVSSGFPLISSTSSKHGKLQQRVSALLKHVASSSTSSSSNPFKIAHHAVASSTDQSPSDGAIESLTELLLQNLLERLQAIDHSALATKSLPVLSDLTFNNVVAEFAKAKQLVNDCMSPQSASIIVAALDDLCQTFVETLTGKLREVELPNVCSKVLVFVNKLKSTGAPTTVQSGANDLTNAITLALTKQNRANIVDICSAVNNLETSLAIVVQNDHCEKLQDLLTGLVNAVKNVIAAGGDVGSNLINVVDRYVANIRNAVQEDSSRRENNIYKSILSFEQDLYSALVGPDGLSIDVPGSSSPSTVPSTTSKSVTSTKLEADTYKSIVNALKPRSTASKNSQNVHEPASSAPSQAKVCLNDASKIVTGNEYFLLKEKIVPKVDQNENVDARRFGEYALRNPDSGVFRSGSFQVEDGSVIVDTDGNLIVTDTGRFDVASLDDECEAVEGTFHLHGATQTLHDTSGNKIFLEKGDFRISDAVTRASTSGKFVVHNTATRLNTDGTIDVFKAGAVLEADSPIPVTDDVTFVVTYDVSEHPDADGIVGKGIYNFNQLESGASTSGTVDFTLVAMTEIGGGSIRMVSKGTIYVSEDDSESPNGLSTSLVLKHGASTTYEDIFVPVIDEYGHACWTGTGKLIQVDTSSERATIINYEIREALIKNNDDRSTTVTIYGVVLPDSSSSTKETSTSASSSNSDAPTSALKTTPDVYQTIIDSVKPLTTDSQKKSTTGVQHRQPSSSIEPTTTTLKVKSTVTEPNYFVIRENIVSRPSDDGNLESYRIGDYTLRNPTTNASSFGKFQVQTAHTSRDANGNLIVEDTGVFVVKTSDGRSLISQGNFEITDSTEYYPNRVNVLVPIETGAYSLTESVADTPKSGKFVVRNTASMVNPDGSIEVLKSGIVVSESTLVATANDPELTFDETSAHYILFVDELYPSPDIDGVLGHAIFNVRNSQIGDSVSGIVDILETSKRENPDGTIRESLTGIIRVQDADLISGNPYLILVDGAKCSFLETAERVVDRDGDVAIVGTGTVVQENPTTGEITRGSYVVRNRLTKIADNGFEQVIKSGVIRNEPSSTSTDSSSTGSGTPLKVTPESYRTFLDSVRPLNTPSSGDASLDSLAVPSSAPGDVTSIASDGKLFIINEKVVSSQDDRGHVNVARSGTYDLVTPNGTSPRSGSFAVQMGSITNDAQGNLQVRDEGIFDVNAPNGIDTAGRGRFTVKDVIPSSGNERGSRPSVESGTYSLSDPLAQVYKTGQFVVHTTISTANEDGSIDFYKTGVMIVDDSKSLSINDPSLGIDANSAFATFVDNIYGTRKADGTFGDGAFNVVSPSTGQTVSGTYQIQRVSGTENVDGSISSTQRIVMVVNDDLSTPESDRTVVRIFDGEVYNVDQTFVATVDKEGHVALNGTAVVSREDPDTGIVTTCDFVIRQAVMKSNDDGSKTLIKSGMITNQSDAPTRPLLQSAKSTSMTRASYNQLRNLLNPSSSDSQTPTATLTDFDLTSIFADGRNFVVDQIIVPEYDNNGNIIFISQTGNNTIFDPRTNLRFLVTFDVAKTTTTTDSKGNILAKSEGTIQVNPVPGTSGSRSGTMSVESFQRKTSDSFDNDNFVETGKYTVTDSVKGTSVSGTCATAILLTKLNDDGTLYVGKAGILNANNDGTDTPATLEQVKNNGGYVFFAEHRNTNVNDQGIYGSGYYQLEDPKTKEYQSGSYEITSFSSTTDPQTGTITTTQTGTIEADSSQSSIALVTPGFVGFLSTGETYQTVDVITPVVDENGTPGFVGTGQLTVQNTSATTTVSVFYTIRDFSRKQNSDGSVDSRKFGTFDRITATGGAPRPQVSPDAVASSAADRRNTLNSLVNILRPGTTSPVLKRSFATYDVTSMVTDGTYFIIDAIVVPRYDANGNAIGFYPRGNYTLADVNTNATWPGTFTITEFNVESDVDGNIVTKYGGTFAIDPVTGKDGTAPATVTGRVVIEKLLIKEFDEQGNSRIKETGSYVLTDSITGGTVSGPYAVANTVTRLTPDGDIKVIKAGVLWVDETGVPRRTPVLPRLPDNSGYMLFNEHRYNAPDSNGNYGFGYYQIKDPKTDEYQTGSYVVEKLFRDEPGTSKVTGRIFVDSSASSVSPQARNSPLIVVDGSEYSFEDTVTEVTDSYGHTTVVGTGVFTQTNKNTGSITTGKYTILDFVLDSHPDGSVDAIKFGIYDRGTSIASASGAIASTIGSDEPSATKESMVTLIDILKDQVSAAPGKTNPNAKTSVTNVQPQELPINSVLSLLGPRVNGGNQANPSTVTVSRGHIKSAIDGQDLVVGDVVVVQTHNGDSFVGHVRDSWSPVVFQPVASTSLTKNCAKASRIWSIPECEFSDQDILNFQIASQSSGCTCD